MKNLLFYASDAPVSSATPAPQPATTAPRVAAQTFNKAQLAELDEAQTVGQAAQQPEYAGVWADWDLPADVGATLVAKVAEAQALLQRAVNAQSEKSIDTAEKEAAKTQITAAIMRVQSGAKVKYLRADDEDAQLKRFFVGVKLGQNDSQLDNIADALLLILANETLPGVKADKIQALRDALAEFKAAEDSQDLNADSSEGLRARAIKMIAEEIFPLRRKIQLAVDAEYPFYDMDNRQTRKTFDLPPAQPFT